MKFIRLASKDGDLYTHAAAGISGYATLCGLSSDDTEQWVHEPGTKATGPIDCHTCKQMWQVARKLKASDFECA